MASNDEEDPGANLSYFPPEIQEHILSFLSYEEISKKRQVCKSFNSIGWNLLNSGFTKADRTLDELQKKIKNLLPRRESERRAHFLARHVGALSSLETRMSLLNMTYMKYIESDLCCFIPGKVLDELFSVLRVLSNLSTQPKAHELMQELRDITSMAMEHFEEHIQPTLKRGNPLDHLLTMPMPASTNSPGGMNAEMIPASHGLAHLPTLRRAPNIRMEVTTLRTRLAANTHSIIDIKKDIKKLKVSAQSKRSETDRKVLELEVKSVKQAQIIQDLTKKVQEQDVLLRELKRKVFGEADDTLKVEMVDFGEKAELQVVNLVDDSSSDDEEVDDDGSILWYDDVESTEDESQQQSIDSQNCISSANQPSTSQAMQSTELPRKRKLAEDEETIDSGKKLKQAV